MVKMAAESLPSRPSSAGRELKRQRERYILSLENFSWNLCRALPCASEGGGCYTHFLEPSGTCDRMPQTEWLACTCAKVLQLCLTLCNPVGCSPPGSSAHGNFTQEHWSGLPFPSPGDLPDPGIFLTQGSNPGLLHCRQILCRPSYEGSSHLWRLEVQDQGLVSPGTSLPAFWLRLHLLFSLCACMSRPNVLCLQGHQFYEIKSHPEDLIFTKSTL